MATTRATAQPPPPLGAPPISPRHAFSRDREAEALEGAARAASRGAPGEPPGAAAGAASLGQRVRAFRPSTLPAARSWVTGQAPASGEAHLWRSSAHALARTSFWVCCSWTLQDTVICPTTSCMPHAVTLAHTSTRPSRVLWSHAQTATRCWGHAYVMSCMCALNALAQAKPLVHRLHVGCLLCRHGGASADGHHACDSEAAAPAAPAAPNRGVVTR